MKIKKMIYYMLCSFIILIIVFIRYNASSIALPNGGILARNIRNGYLVYYSLTNQDTSYRINLDRIKSISRLEIIDYSITESELILILKDKKEINNVCFYQINIPCNESEAMIIKPLNQNVLLVRDLYEYELNSKVHFDNNRIQVGMDEEQYKYNDKVYIDYFPIPVMFYGNIGDIELLQMVPEGEKLPLFSFDLMIWNVSHLNNIGPYQMFFFDSSNHNIMLVPKNWIELHDGLFNDARMTNIVIDETFVDVINKRIDTLNREDIILK